MASNSVTKTKAPAKTASPKSEAPAAETVKDEAKVKKTYTPKNIDSHTYVRVTNGFQGLLTYISRHTGERFHWESFGDTQEMELGELKNAKSAAKKFFENNWFMFDEDPWVIDYLGVGQYYKNALSMAEFDTVLNKDADELVPIIRALSDGQKRSLSYLARKKIADKEIDSIKTIEVLEAELGTELIER